MNGSKHIVFQIHCSAFMILKPMYLYAISKSY